jgi:hypothetical protein
MCEKIAVKKLSDLKQASQVCHVIKVKDETPIRQKTRPIPYHLHGELRKMLKEMLDVQSESNKTSIKRNQRKRTILL